MTVGIATRRWGILDEFKIGFTYQGGVVNKP